MRILFWLIAALGGSLACFPAENAPKLGRWCCISDAEVEKCQALAHVASRVVTSNETVNLTCVRGDGVTDCMSRIQRDEADLVTLGEEDIYIAGAKYGLRPVVAEDYGSKDKHIHYAVALVRSTTTVNITTLKGAITCHPRAEDMIGWKIPVGFLIWKKLMQRKDCDVYNSAGEFFGKSCVPGVFDAANNLNNTKLPSLCGACSNPTCPGDESERYYGYNGSYVCLVEGRGEVAFVRHTTVFEYTGVINDLNPGFDFKLLCPDGTVKGVGYYEECNLATIPARVVMTTDSSPDFCRVRRYRSFLLEFQSILLENQTLFDLFNSSVYNGTDLLFKDTTKRLVDVYDRNTTEKWLGERYYGALNALNSCELPTVVTRTVSSSGQTRPRNYTGVQALMLVLWYLGYYNQIWNIW